jgi:hypothetical protein
MVIELRRYRLRPGRRDELIELFDREFVESQEELGMRVLGQFRDLDQADDFVWLRAFPEMASRPRALSAFYDGPVWAEHGPAANATMIDSDDVLLLRPVVTRAGWEAGGLRPPPGATGDGPGAVLIITREMSIPMSHLPGTPVAELVTEQSPNNFPRLPIRVDEDVHVSVSTLRNAADAAVIPPIEGLARLIPTARSLLHG